MQMKKAVIAKELRKNEQEKRIIIRETSIKDILKNRHILYYRCKIKVNPI